MGAQSFYRRLEELAQAGEPVVTATVIAARGSTPREAGARMIVHGDGRMSGSVGGGCGEAQVLLEAARAFDGASPRLCEVDLSGEIDDESATHCGGVMEVFLDPVRWDKGRAEGLADLALVRAVRAASHAQQPVAVAVAVGPGTAGVAPGSKWLVDASGALHGAAPGALGGALRTLGMQALASGASRGCARAEGLAIYVEVVAPAPQLVIAGAGHIAQPLCRMAKELDFEVVVIDDRASFANRARFPQADEILVGPFAEVLTARPPGPATHLALVTRGHQQDEAVLKAVIGSGAAYIGMIGSRRRVREVFRHLSAAGVPQELIDRVQAPVGLDIGARTPAEIALSILAQLVQLRAGRGAGAGPQLVLIKGAGDLATGCAVRLHRAGYAVAMIELEAPTAVRRTVAFSECVAQANASVEGVQARRAATVKEARAILAQDEVAVLVDPEARLGAALQANVVVDARMAKRNLGTSLVEAAVVIGIGPGFLAGHDVDAVVETQRGHSLGRVILDGAAQPNTGVPGEIGGKTVERLLRAPAGGMLRTRFAIGDAVEAGAAVGEVAGRQVLAATGGIVRGLLRDGTPVREGQKIGDVDPRARREHCFSVSDKARAVAGGVLEAILYLSSTANPASGRSAAPMSTRVRRGAPRSSRRRASA